MSDYKIIDGCTAATYVAYALSDVATIYPISPVAEMGQIADKWAMQGVKNLMGQPMKIEELESELGAAGATHGALVGGALATTFTNSQGLMLMIPNMYKIAGELLPAVFHIGTRSTASHALSIFGDHQDVMTARATGFAYLASSSVQSTHDLALVAHLAAIEGRVPVLHFFDGWRTANEMSTIDMLPYESMRPLVDWDKVRQFRGRAMNPEHPQMRGTAQNPDVYFQNREAANSYYDAFPDIVQAQMDKVACVTGRHYHLFDYSGDPEADTVLISMASSAEVISSTIAILNTQGYKAGAINVRLYRPFSAERLLEALPPTTKYVAVLDRCKEPGSLGEPLFLDVAAAIQASGREIRVIGGRYGLSSKEFDPSMVLAVVKNARSQSPVRGFTVGIDDDLTHLSLDYSEKVVLPDENLHQAVFYGIGADGTVGATKMAAGIFGDSEGMFAQAFFSYSAKKSGGYTISQLRIAPKPINAEFNIEEADYVGCNKDTYVKTYPLLHNIKDGGIFTLNSSWNLADMEIIFPAALKRQIAAKKLRLYNVDASALAHQCGLGVRINTVMLTAFLRLSGIMDFDAASDALKQKIKDMYIHEGQPVVDSNLAAVDAAASAITQIDYPASWLDAVDTPQPKPMIPIPAFVKNIAKVCNSLRGDSIPVSMLSPDGVIPMGTSAFEKRCIANYVPVWDVDKCIECTQCSLVCPHAAIRPVVMSAEEKAAAPADMVSKAGFGPLKDYQYRIQVHVEDCQGCTSCVQICPGHALSMVPRSTQMAVQVPLRQYAELHIPYKGGLLPRTTVRGTQLYQPLLEYSGACAGCGETPYVKLLTQLFGERMLIANATGCSSIWGADFPSNPYCTNSCGHGPAWGNSLFEDNAEYGYGIAVAIAQRRDLLRQNVEALAATQATPQTLKDAAGAWLQGFSDASVSRSAGQTLLQAVKTAIADDAMKPVAPLMQSIIDDADLLAKKSIWCVGGDGWAYDIGFAGLDHVLAQNIDINILVLDTECYSNTGGQTSKATPLAAVAKYSADGKRTNKKNLGQMMMTYGSVYVASVALGSNYQGTVDALVEAEAYPGPSIVIAYCPCIAHGIRVGLGHSIIEERSAVASGYWITYRYNPQLAREGKNPFTVDSPEPNGQLLDFINGEDRYVDLKRVDPNEAAILQPELQDHCDEQYALLVQEAQLPAPPVKKAQPTPSAS